MQSLKYMAALVIVLAAATIVTCVQHEFTIYSYRNATGDSITFRTKQPELSKWKFFWYIFSERYICWTGSWALYSGENYRNTVRTWGFQETRFCLTMDLNFVNSLRHLGPVDTSIESISFYNGTMTYPTSGDEFTLRGDGGVDTIEYMPFVPTALVATGNSNLTLYSGPNFTGSSTCMQSTTEFVTDNLVDGRFYLSVKRGCQLDADEYIQI